MTFGSWCLETSNHFLPGVFGCVWLIPETMLTSATKTNTKTHPAGLRSDSPEFQS